MGLAFVAVVGIAAGSGLGAALYNFNNDASLDIVGEENSVSPAFAAAVEAVFDTSPVTKKTVPADEAVSELQITTVTAAQPTDSVEAVDTDSKQGLTWTPGESKKTRLPNVVVVSSVTPVKVAQPQPTRVASLLPVAAAVRQTTDVPQTLIPAGTERFATTEPRRVFAKDPLPARVLKEQIEADMQSSPASTISEADVDVAETEAEVIGMEYKLASLGSQHFVALPEPVATVEEAVALQNGWKTTANKYVNLRARPNNNGEVLAIVPAQAELLMEKDCKRWCSVIYKGQKGYIHRTFISQPKRPKVIVDIAETEAEVIALETRMAAQGSDQFVAAAQSVAAFAAQTAADHGYKKSYATKYVNLRAGPKKDAEVLNIIPADAEFMAEPDCKHWCSVVYQGQKGYIYRTYMQYARNQP
ncbi:MAG: SH3 domain-containing protein [Hyphomicrobiales bacterium]|nr:SH3 domain-containing protein [Hyphomicrobiales bacterium]